METKMECKNCGSPIYEGDKFCSKCGTRVVEEVTTETKAPANDEKAQSGYVEAAKSERPLSIPEEKPSKARGRKAAFLSGKPKKWIPKVILGILCITVVVLLANSAKIANSWHRNFSTPEEYYRWVERKAMQENARAFAEYYANHFKEYLHNYDRHTSSEIRVELGDAGRDMMELAGLEPWFEEGTLTYESTSRNGVFQDTFGLVIGGEKLFSMNAVMDLKDETIYLGFPDLTKTYLGLDTGEAEFADVFEDVFGMEPEEYLEYLELLEVFYKECPDKKQMEALVNRYMELLLDSIEGVRMRTGKTARAGGVTQDCTTLEIYLDKGELQDILTELLEELQEDSEIEKLLLQIYELAEELDLYTGYYRDADDFYESFQDSIDDILDDIDYYVTYHEELDMTIYVDDKGQIIGRTLEFPNSWDEVSFSYLNPHHGNKFGYKGSIIVDGEEIQVTGSGKESWNKTSGSFTVKSDGTGIVDIEVEDLDMKSLKKGYLNGRFTVSVASGIGRASGYYSAYSYLSEMKLIVDISTSRSSEKLNIELREGKELWGSLTITSKSGSGKKISIPSTKSTIFAEDDRDFEDWWDTVEWNSLIKKMDKAGLPSDIVDTVEGFDGMDLDEFLEELSHRARFWFYDLMDEFY